MRTERFLGLVVAGFVAGFLPYVANAQIVISEGTNISADVSSADGRIAFDLLGTIWIVPGYGGDAKELANTVLPARLPRWSPGGQQLLYQVSSVSGNQLWLQDTGGGKARRLSSGNSSDQLASWHPDGERVVFSSSGTESGLDLWELDIPTGLRWRLSDFAGDETEAVWSANGRHLAYIWHSETGWSLMIRRRGEPDRELFHSELELRVPSFRPDGSLITFLRRTENGYMLDMAILSEPPLVRPYSIESRDFFVSPVSWIDRHRMLYTADGMLLSRNFDDRRAKPIQFRAMVDDFGQRPKRKPVSRPLPIVAPPDGKLVIRAARLFDGIAVGYRSNVDVVLEGGVISTVTARQDWPDLAILDLGDATILPGFIDVYSALPDGNTGVVGAGLLSYGVTTIVTDDHAPSIDTARWHTERRPGPRFIRAGDAASAVRNVDELYLAILPANSTLDDGTRKTVRMFQQQGIPVMAENWTIGLGLGVDLLLGADTLPMAPKDGQYEDMQVAVSGGPVTLVSGLADSGTPGLRELLQSRQASRFGQDKARARQYANPSQLGGEHVSVVLGSKPGGLPPGLALHAELRALAAAGLSGDQVLRAAGANVGKALGLEQQIGVVQAGALADLVVVTGDPLKNVADTLKIIAVVRNGRFYSLISLLERNVP